MNFLLYLNSAACKTGLWKVIELNGISRTLWGYEFNSFLSISLCREVLNVNPKESSEQESQQKYF